MKRLTISMALFGLVGVLLVACCPDNNFECPSNDSSCCEETQHEFTRVEDQTSEEGEIIGYDCFSWAAWVDLMPPKPDALFVQGEIEVPHPGHEATLIPSDDIIIPETLILDLKLERKPGIWPQIITTLTPRYEDFDYAGGYDCVLIRFPDGSECLLPIEDVY